jgi:hypothetical protein
VANIDPSEIQRLLDEVENLKTTIEAIGHTERAKRDDIKLGDVTAAIIGAAAKFDPAEWSLYAEDKQNDLKQRLEAVRDSLFGIVHTTGPKEPSHIMYDDYGSNRAIILLALFGFAVAGILVLLIASNWRKATGTDYALAISKAVSVIPPAKEARDKEIDAKIELSKRSSKLEEARNKKDEESRKKVQEEFDKQLAVLNHVVETSATAKANALDAFIKFGEHVNAGAADEGSVLLMVMLLGALGGTLHLLGSLVKYVGNREFKRSWILYYVSLPMNGAILAPIIYMLLRVGILSPSNVATGGSSIANLNLIAIYAFAALTGLFSKVASDKLSEVFQNLFRSEPTAKDQIRPGITGTSGKST